MRTFQVLGDLLLRSKIGFSIVFICIVFFFSTSNKIVFISKEDFLVFSLNCMSNMNRFSRYTSKLFSVKMWKNSVLTRFFSPLSLCAF